MIQYSCKGGNPYKQIKGDDYMFFGIFGFIALICCGLADDKTTVGFFVTVGIVIPILAMLMSGEIMGVIIWSFLVAVFYFMVFGE